MERLLGRRRLEELPVVRIELGQRLDDLLLATLIERQEQDAGEQAMAVLLHTAAVVVDVRLALASNDVAALGGAVQFDEVAVLVVAVSEADEGVGLEDLALTTDAVPGAPAGWFGLKDQILDVLVGFELSEADVQLADAQDVIGEEG